MIATVAAHQTATANNGSPNQSNHGLCGLKSDIVLEKRGEQGRPPRACVGARTRGTATNLLCAGRAPQ